MLEKELKESLLDVIADLEEQGQIGPIIFKWGYEEAPQYTIVLGIKKETFIHPEPETAQ